MKKVRVFPGFYLDISKSGVKSSTKSSSKDKHSLLEDNSISAHLATSSGEIKSAKADMLTSSSFKELESILSEAYLNRTELHRDLEQAKIALRKAKSKRQIACFFLIGFLFKSFKDAIVEKQNQLNEIEKQLGECFVDIELNFDAEMGEKYHRLIESYKTLLATEIIWDITSAVQQDTKITRSAASTVVTRTPVNFKFDNIDIIQSAYKAFHFENKNGGDLYIYPTFVIMTNSKREFGIIDILDFELQFSATRFLEEQKIPSDTKIIDETWAKVNKNGQPDKRFKDNYKIPIVRYGEILLKSHSGLNEAYSFSSFEKSELFSLEFNSYKGYLNK